MTSPPASPVDPSKMLTLVQVAQRARVSERAIRDALQEFPELEPPDHALNPVNGRSMRLWYPDRVDAWIDRFWELRGPMRGDGARRNREAQEAVMTNQEQVKDMHWTAGERRDADGNLLCVSPRYAPGYCDRVALKRGLCNRDYIYHVSHGNMDQVALPAIPNSVALARAHHVNRDKNQAPRESPPRSEPVPEKVTSPSPPRRATCIDPSGCTKPADRRGLCRAHYDVHYSAGDLDQVANPSRRGFSKEARAARRLSISPTSGPTIPRSGQCIEPTGCDRTGIKRGLCNKHYNFHLYHGDLEQVTGPSRRGFSTEARAARWPKTPAPPAAAEMDKETESAHAAAPLVKKASSRSDSTEATIPALWAQVDVLRGLMKSLHVRLLTIPVAGKARAEQEIVSDEDIEIDV